MHIILNHDQNNDQNHDLLLRLYLSHLHFELAHATLHLPRPLYESKTWLSNRLRVVIFTEVEERSKLQIWQAEDIEAIALQYQ